MKNKDEIRIGRLHDLVSVRRELARVFRAFRRGEVEVDELRACTYTLKVLHEMLLGEANRPARLEVEVKRQAEAVDYDALSDSDLDATYQAALGQNAIGH